METQSIARLSPGLFMTEMILRLHNIEIDVRQLRRHSDSNDIGPKTILSCMREFGVRARVRKTDWKWLSKYPLPGIAMLKGGGFLLLGRVGDDEAVVLASDGSPPSVVSRATFESEWNRRLLYIVKDSSLKRPYDRVQELLTATALLRAAGRAGSLARNLREAAELHLKEAALRHNLSPAGLRSLITSGPSKLNGQALATGVGTAIVDLAQRSRRMRNSLVVRPINEARRRSEEIAFLPAALEIVETPPSPLGRATAICIAALFTVAIAWSCLGKVDIVAVATGAIVPTGGTKAIQPFEIGVVRAIDVQDGQVVKAGDVLVELDTTTSAAELSRIRSDLIAANLEVARLRAALKSDDDPEAEFHPSPSAPGEIVEMHRRLLASQSAEEHAKLATIDRQTTQKEAERATVKATIDKLVATLTPLQQVDIQEYLVQKELTSKLTYLTAFQQLVEHKQEIKVQQSRFDEANAAVAALTETRAKTAAEYQRGLLSDLAAAEEKSTDLTHDVVKAEQRTKLQTLKAPVDGMVQQLAVHTVGGVVTPAQTLMLVVPAASGLEIQAGIPNRDVGFVRPGQDVAIKIDTFNFTRYGLLHGKLLSVSQDAVARSPQTSSNDRNAGSAASEARSQDPLYSARISIDRDYMDIDGKRVTLSAGMASTVEIRTGNRRIISYLLSPLLRYGHEALRER